MEQTKVNNGSFIAYDKVAFKDLLNNSTHASLGLLAENGYGAGVSVEPILILLLSVFHWFTRKYKHQPTL